MERIKYYYNKNNNNKNNNNKNNNNKNNNNNNNKNNNNKNNNNKLSAVKYYLNNEVSLDDVCKIFDCTKQSLYRWNKTKEVVI